MTIVFVTNILTPYRKVFFEEMNQQCKLLSINFWILVMAAGEYNRHWNYNEYATEYTKLLKGKSIRIKNTSIHINYGTNKIISTIRPDIVIIGGGYLNLTAWDVLRYWKKRNVYCFFWSESHIDEERPYKEWIIKMRDKIRKKFYSNFNYFLCPGKKAVELVRKYAGEEAVVLEIPNLIDDQKFLLNIKRMKKEKDILLKKYRLSDKKYKMFSPMRLSWEKGLEPFMKIVSKSNVKEAVQLIVAGDGELELQLREMAKELNIDLVLLGYKEQKEIIELFSIADCFFLPSLSDSSPLSCVEALWCGLPIFISTHVGNAPEVVEQGENGYIFELEDQKKAIQLLEQMISADEEWTMRAKEKSLDIAENRFNLKKRTRNLLDDMMRIC